MACLQPSHLASSSSSPCCNPHPPRAPLYAWFLVVYLRLTFVRLIPCHFFFFPTAMFCLLLLLLLLVLFLVMIVQSRWCRMANRRIIFLLNNKMGVFIGGGLDFGSSPRFFFLLRYLYCYRPPFFFLNKFLCITSCGLLRQIFSLVLFFWLPFFFLPWNVFFSFRTGVFQHVFGCIRGKREREREDQVALVPEGGRGEVLDVSSVV